MPQLPVRWPNAPVLRIRCSQNVTNVGTMNIKLLPQQFDVTALLAQLKEHPEIWNEYRWRTEHPRSPHREVDDIWVRYNSIENIGPHFNDEHEAVWYPVVEKIPGVKDLVSQVMEAFGGEQLGGVLITRVPPGKQVYPHVDLGWHALHYEKFAVQLKGNSSQAFCFSGEKLSALPGEAYWFNNQSSHWVVNPSDEDRITLIVCMRRVH